MNQEIKKKITQQSISLEEYGLNDLAWSKEDAKDLISGIMKNKIGVLGGDVYKITATRLEPLADNWSCEPKESEPVEEYYLRSKSESLKYIESYPVQPGEKIIFSIIFTERIDKQILLTKLACKVCGNIQYDPPWGEDGKTPTFDICNCCGVQFGYEDFNVFYVKKFREEWIKKGAKWFYSKVQPENWSLDEQMKNIPKEFK